MLEISDYNQDERMLKVHGKCSKERSVYLADGAISALGAWLEIGGDESSSIFVTVNKGNNLVIEKSLKPQSI